MHRGEATARGVYWFVSSFPHFADFYIAAMVLAIMTTPALIASGCVATLWKPKVKWSPFEYLFFIPLLMLWEWTSRQDRGHGETGGNLLVEMACICLLAILYVILRRSAMSVCSAVFAGSLFTIAACGTLFAVMRYTPMIPFPF